MSKLIKNLIFKIRFYFAKEYIAVDPASANGDNTVTIFYKTVDGKTYLTGQITHTNKETISYV